MPRPKVRPDARRRVAQACRQCKISKRKCNASLPCNHCIKRGIASTCDLADEARSQGQPASATHPVETQQSITVPQDHLPTDTLETNRENDTTTVDETLSSVAASDTAATYESFDVASPDTTRPCMLSNNDGEYVFVGRSASLSFLQLVRETVTRCVGPCEFSEYAGKDYMLEVDLTFNGDVEQEIILSSNDTQSCEEHYVLATIGLIDIFAPGEIYKLLNTRLGNSSYLAAIRLLVIAIGKQAAPIDGDPGDDIGKRAFAQARIMMFTNMLENPSTDMVRAFLLLAFYVLGACRRNAAFLYLGIAARAAHTLGLHTIESYSLLSDERRHAQLRCWKSLVSLDLIVSSILGRTTAVLAQRGNTNTIVNITDSISNHPSTELEAAYRLALQIDSISNKFNGSGPVTAAMAQSHLEDLKKWSSILPTKLRPSTLPDGQSSAARQSLLGCMHISCFYYFAVMLVTRPFLIIHVTRRLFRNKRHVDQVPASDGSDTEELAFACLDAATFMAQTCLDLLSFNLLAENMCILKAWIFAAGMVLGFEMFASSGSERGVERAFGSCRQVLEKLSVRSPQAYQYYEILTLLASAVDKHRQMQRSKKSHGAASLVTRIMDLQSFGGSRVPLTPPSSTRGSFQPLSAQGLEYFPADNTFANTDPSFLNNTGDFVDGMNEFSSPSADSFMFDLQSFGMMPWSVS